MSEPREGPLRDPIWQFIGVTVGVISIVFNATTAANPIVPVIGSGVSILLVVAAVVWISVTPKPACTDRRWPRGLVAPLFLILVAGMLALARFWPLLGWPALGRLLGLAPWVLILGFFAALVLAWRSHRLKSALKTSREEPIRRIQSLLLPWLILGTFAFGDQIEIWWLQNFRGTDVLALLGDIEDETIRTNLARLCQDSDLWRTGQTRFTCADSVPSPQLDADAGALLDDYRLNRSLAGLVWIGLPAARAPSQPAGMVIRRRPFLEGVVTDVSLSLVEHSTWPDVSAAILEHASMLKCAQGQSQAVVALAQHWQDAGYAPDDQRRAYHPAYLRCFAESALDAQAFLAFDDMRAEIMRGIGDVWADPDIKSSERQLFGLTYARLLIYSGQSDEAQGVLEQVDRYRNANSNTDPQVQTIRRRVLAELSLSRCQSALDDAAGEQHCRAAVEAFSGLLGLQSSPLERYGLGRAQVLLSLYGPADEASPLRKRAINGLRLVQFGWSPSCLKQNADRWIGFAQALDGKAMAEDRIARTTSDFGGCQYGVNVSIPLAVSSETITATVGLPAPGLHYAVVSLDYSDRAASGVTALNDLGNGLYQAHLTFPGPPDDPISFVYHDRVPQPHIELQKTFQIGIQSKVGNERLDAFPIVMYGRTSLEIEHSSAEPINLTVGDSLTITAWIAGKLPLMDEARILNDATILERLAFCVALAGERLESACQTHSLAPTDQPGYYQGERLFQEPGTLPLSILAVDRGARTNVVVLQSHVFTVEVTAPLPEVEHDETRVAVLAKGPLRIQADTNAQVRYTLPSCTGALVQNISGEGSWYRVRILRSGLPISGWAPVENVLLVRVFEGDHLPALAIARDALDIYPRHGASVYQVPECTLLELVSRPEAGRWVVKIYADRGSDPDQGWIDPDQPGIETLLLIEP